MFRQKYKSLNMSKLIELAQSDDKKAIEELIKRIQNSIYATIFSSNITMSINPVVGLAIICAVGALISMVGDLAASAIKRNHDIKDYGKLIPGHGGIMDRFDSVIYVAPVIWILLQIF